MPGTRLATRLRRVKHARKELWFEVPKRRAYLNITPQVEEFVRESGIANGLCLVNPMHITAAVYVNDDERGLLRDIDDWLERLAPHEPVRPRAQVAASLSKP